MRRFATGLLVVILAMGLSFPAPALATGKSRLGALSAGQVEESGQNGGRAWYVAADGSDENPGTFEMPFATISYATSQMEGGDTVYVRGGTYRDEVTYVPSGSEERPSTICAYNGEEVWMTGGEPIAEWAQMEEDSNIWVADMDWDMGGITEYSEIGVGEDAGHSSRTAHYDNLVFVDGDPAPEGRWPNATVDQFLDRERYAVADRASSGTIVDADLPDDVDFTGSEVWVASGGGYESQTATVNSYDSADKRLHIKANGGWMYDPRGGNYYYVTKSLKTLDAAGEWYKDTERGKLYLYEPDEVDPATLGVEAQKRAHVVKIGYATDGKGSVTYENASYITFRGINARLGAVSFSPATSHCVFEQATVDCPDHKISSQAYGVGTGVLLSGTDDLVTRCEIKHAYGSAVSLWGSNNSAVNNHIHDTGYEHHEEEAAIRMGGSGQLVSHNTVHHVMRSAISGFFEASVISYNDLYDCMRVSRDGGVVYFNLHDFGNTEFHHNWLHDTKDFPFDQMHVGLYMDSFTTSLVVYRNVVWGIQQYEEGNRDVNNNGRHLTYQINPNSLNNVILNNTFVNYRPTHLNFYANHDISGTVYVNNIFQSMSFIDGSSYYPWRWYDVWDRETHISSSRVPRDVLKEMGAWFDQDHNLEGRFINNTWPPIGNQWNDPTQGDYTLAPDSEAIDKGCSIAGITDDYEGAAPDLGAYEYGGEAWVPGCDLDRDIEEKLEFNEAIPYRNVLSNRGFEKLSAVSGGQSGESANVDFADWDESGTPQVSDEMSAWTTWGWVTKHGSRCAVLDSDGDALTQHVTGLKKNATYRVGGYGFVAGKYVRPANLTQAEGASGPVDESSLSRMRRGNLLSLDGLTKLEFANVDFGEGRDRIALGLRNPKVNSGDGKQVYSIALGSPDNVVGSYEMTKSLSQAEINWRWVTIDLGGTYEGPQDVYLVLSGSYSETLLSGFFPDCPASSDMLSIKATAPGGEASGEVAITSWYKPFEGSYYAPHSDVVKTDGRGELDIVISKRGGDLVAYADEIFLSELPTGENFGSTGACTHVFKKAEGEPKWEWRTVDGYRRAFLTLTCDECGEEVEIDVPTTKQETDMIESSTASFAVVGAVYSSSEDYLIPYNSISVAENIAHGTVSVDRQEAKRGMTVNVTTEPDEGYGLKELKYKTDLKGATNNDITRRGYLSMPSYPVIVNATFEPVFYVRAIGDVAYNGSPIEPPVVVLYGDKELEEGADYTLDFEDNVEIGTATVTVTGQGEYADSSLVSTFAITPIDLSGAEISGLTSRVYSGEAFEPAPTVKIDGEVLEPGVDYTVAFENNVKAGFATVSVQGIGVYSGTASTTFEIKSRSVSDARISGLADRAYTGKAIMPVPKVRVGGVELKSGRDFTLDYKNNVKIGSAIVKITGKGNYRGSIPMSFKITKRDNTLVVRTATKALSAKALAKSKRVVKPVVASKARGSVTYAKGAGSWRLSVARRTGAITVRKETPKGVYRAKVIVKAAGEPTYKAGTVVVVAKVKVR